MALAYAWAAPAKGDSSLADTVRKQFPSVAERLRHGGAVTPTTRTVLGESWCGFRVGVADGSSRMPTAPAGLKAVEAKAWLDFAKRSQGAPSPTLGVFLPERYDQPFAAELGSQRVVLRATGARPSVAEAAQGSVSYAGVYDGVDSLQVAAEGAGSEEFLLLKDPSARLTFDYELVELSGVSDVIVADGRVRFVRDGERGPEIELARPWLVDATGKKPADAVAWQVQRDASGLPTSVRLQVKADGLAFPLLVDPSFTTTGSLGTARYNHTATLLPSGKVLVAGGVGIGDVYLASSELYDPATGTWTSTTGPLGEPRSHHTSTLLPSGQVLVAGGFGNSGSLASSELYDPGAGTWTSTAGPLGTARGVHTATLLPSGQVLVAGGFGNSGSLASSELYDPGTGTWTSTTGPLGTDRWVHTATLLPSGKVLVAAGFANSGTLASSELYDPGTGTWTGTTGPLGTARDFHTATLLPSGKVLVAGGFGIGDVSLASSELYDPGAGTWTSTGSLGTARDFHTATLLPGGKVLVAGGVGNSSALASSELYDAGAGTWTSTNGPLGTARSTHTATLLPSGQVLVAGGYNGGYLASSELYDSGEGTFTSTAGPLGTARYFHTATLLPSGRVLVAGGFNGGYLASSELYDPGAGTWTSTGSLGTARRYHRATLLPSGKVLVAGGIGIGDVYLASSELYDPATGTWTSTTGSLGTARYVHTATLLPSGKVLVAGGRNSGGSLASSELYDPATGTWTSTTGSLGSARFRHTATLLPSGKVLVAGGFGSISFSLASSELYDPATGTWTSTMGSLGTARYAHTATLLPSGKVLVAGGDYNSGALASSELYDPVTGTWTSTTGSLGTAREAHGATLLPSGRVLVAGGVGNSGYLASSELYDPGTGTWTSTGSLGATRFYHTATLLPSGKVLVAGGSNSGGTLASSELFDEGLGYLDAWRPVLSSFPDPAAAGTSVTANGSQFTGLSEASGGGTSNSASNYPLLQLRRIDNEETLFLPLDPASGFSDTAFVSGTTWAINNGPALAKVFTNGIPSVASYTFVEPPPAVLSGMKYYDANANGQWDGGEPGIASWPISYTVGPTSTLFATLPDGTFSLTLDPATYALAESVSSNTRWLQTGNLTDQSLTAGVTLNGNKTYTVDAAAGGTYPGLYFGNLCLGPGGSPPGGATGLGFWTSKNGQALITASDLTALTALNLRNANGTDFDPATNAQLKTWLGNAKATNMAYMLSAHLATMKLNVLHGFVSVGELIRAVGTTSANAAGFATVGAVMAEADAELGLHGLTKSGSPYRAYQQALKNALESADMNQTFVQPTPATCPAPF